MEILNFQSKGVEIIVNLSEKVTPLKFVKDVTPILQDFLNNSDIKATNISEHFKDKNISGIVYYGIGEDKLKPLFIVVGDKTRKSKEYALTNYMMPYPEYSNLTEDLGNAFGN